MYHFEQKCEIVISKMLKDIRFSPLAEMTHWVKNDLTYAKRMLAQSDHIFSSRRKKPTRLTKNPMRALGPSVIVYPLITLTIIAFILLFTGRQKWALFLGALSLGLIFFIHSFVLLIRKRTIENCPTSKIRSMPMGEVEITGYVKQKYSLKSPYTMTDCVYYSYKVYEKEWTNHGDEFVLKNWGNSGRIPFYLDDNTGSVLIHPSKAVIHAGITQTLQGAALDDLRRAGYVFSSKKKKIVETIIAPGHFLYIIGFAHRIKLGGGQKMKKIMARLRALKADKNSLKRYDADQNGKINREERELAGKDREEKFLLEHFSAQPAKDSVAIGEHPLGGLFYISDKREKVIVKSLAWKIFIYFILGLFGISGGVYYLSMIL